MPKKPPPVSLRKPPAVVDLHKAEEFVRKAEAHEDVRASERPDVEASNNPPPRAAPAKGKPGRKLPKSLVARSDGRTLRRMTLYLPDDLARRLAVHCAREDQEMSAVVSEAVRRHLAKVSDE